MRTISSRIALWMAFLFMSILSAAAAPPQTQNEFNKYILQAVEYLEANRAAMGYDNFALSEDLQFGDFGILKAQNPPLTMCVAASLEVFVRALNIWSKETGNYSPFHFIPKQSWQRLRPRDFRGQIWIVKNSPSHGFADALSSFGMGDRAAFSELAPGNFVNFNRINKSGHSVIFMSYLDREGKELDQYSDRVAGFKYFSSQGKGQPDAGFGFRWAFFEGNCPKLPQGNKRDCHILRSESKDLLVSGFALPPTDWDREKATAFVNESNAITDPAFTTEGEFDPNYFTGVTADE
jgi:hypothetical protein